MEYTAEDGSVFLWKLCDLCLYDKSEGPDTEKDYQSGSLGNFEEWKEIVDEALHNPQVEVAASNQSPSATGLEPVEEEAGES